LIFWLVHYKLHITKTHSAQQFSVCFDAV